MGGRGDAGGHKYWYWDFNHTAAVGRVVLLHHCPCVENPRLVQF
ncbi:hypothetical protein HAL07_14950 [Helicobacter ailurogastricus]|uniref:Uncharacterized protein n=1 Tax=Helicobacter ailurogastricus TaxID=1578720 RepID=A0A0K2Y7A6_9HELI|nr:hypothetical protein HAL07_14950 [Helicobacter ailurogastricus]